MKKLAGWTLLIYAVITFVGGIIGHLKAQSTASLVVGCIFAAILATSASMTFAKKPGAFVLSMTTTVLLAIFFAYRFILTFKFMPAGMMCVLSLGVIGVLLYSGWKSCLEVRNCETAKKN